MTASGRKVWRLDNVEDLFELLIVRQSPSASLPRPEEVGELHCARCREPRRMRVDLLYNGPLNAERPGPILPAGPQGKVVGRYLREPNRLDDFGRALMKYTCFQCEATYAATVFPSPDGPSVAILGSVRGGGGTPNTPAAVAYYLDQAHRAHMAGANSAAVAMYRAAVEQLLHHEGYTARMLGPKIQQLETAVAAGTAPRWATDMPPGVLTIVKNLGNGAVHPNDGDITKQDALDIALVRQLERVVAWLLLEVYEVPGQRAAALAQLQAASTSLK